MNRIDTPAASIPLLHITDLYHPPQDPDDQVDLATVLALPEFDLRGVVLDVTEKFTRAAPEGWDVPRDPGFVTVAQAGYLSGRAIPAAMGLRSPLTSPADDGRSRSRREQAGVELVLAELGRATSPVVVSIVGSARVLTAAFNRAPDLVRERVRSVLLNAGSTTTAGELEWNVRLDPAAFVGLWRSGLPVHWYPCATERGAFDPTPERGTHWSVSHETLFRDLPAAWRAWFAYGFTGSARGDVVRALDELGAGATWEHVMAGKRALWSTASLVMAAGRRLTKTGEGWRFVSPAEATAESAGEWPLRLDAIETSIDDAGRLSWSLATGREGAGGARLFGRQPGAAYGEAMAEALNALLRQLGD